MSLTNSARSTHPIEVGALVGVSGPVVAVTLGTKVGVAAVMAVAPSGTIANSTEALSPEAGASARMNTRDKLRQGEAAGNAKAATKRPSASTVVVAT